MNKLPEINSTAFINIQGAKRGVIIVAHFGDKAIFVYETPNSSVRCDMSVAANFEQIPVIKPFNPVKPEKQQVCVSGNHNYVQIGEAHTNRAFCTRCGHTINLE